MPEDPMRCQVPEEDLSALVDGELSEARADELRRHVPGCARCAARVAAFERTNARLAALPSRPVPADLRARLQERIAADRESSGAPKPHRAPPPARRRWLASPALATAAAVAAAVALYWGLVPADEVAPEIEIEQPRLAQEPAQAPAPVPDPLPLVPEPLSPRLAEMPTPLPETPSPDLGPEGVPPTHVAEAQSAPEVLPAPDAEFDPVPAEEVELALELDTIEDLDVVANLELLEALVALGGGTG